MNNVASTDIVDNEKVSLYSITKKIMDLVLSFIGLILLIPVFLILAILVKLDSKGPVFYAHTRKGKNRSDIKIYKFRTMYSNSDEIFESFSDEQKEEYYKNFKLDNDPRVTKIGDFLRRTSLDEIPQLANVLKERKEIRIFQKKKKIRRKTMDSRTDKFMKLMEQLGADIDMPDEFEFDSPDEEVIHEWDELEGGGMDET